MAPVNFGSCAILGWPRRWPLPSLAYCSCPQRVAHAVPSGPAQTARSAPLPAGPGSDLHSASSPQDHPCGPLVQACSPWGGHPGAFPQPPPTRLAAGRGFLWESERGRGSHRNPRAFYIKVWQEVGTSRWQRGPSGPCGHGRGHQCGSLRAGLEGGRDPARPAGQGRPQRRAICCPLVSSVPAPKRQPRAGQQVGLGVTWSHLSPLWGVLWAS